MGDVPTTGSGPRTNWQVPVPVETDISVWRLRLALRFASLFSVVHGALLQRAVRQVCDDQHLLLLSHVGTQLGVPQETDHAGDSPVRRRYHQSSG